MRKHDLPVGLQESERRHSNCFSRLCAQVNEIGQLWRGHLEGGIGKRLLRRSDNPMICEHRVRDDFHIALGHMAANTIVRRLLLLPLGKRNGAALLRVAGQAALAEVIWRFRGGRLCMRIMAGNTPQSARALAIAFAQAHREIVFEQIVLRRRLRREWHHEDA